MGEARTVFPDDFKFNRDVFKGVGRYFPGILQKGTKYKVICCEGLVVNYFSLSQ